MDEVTVQIGKNGLNDNTISAIVTHLRNNRYVRVKFLRSFLGSTDRFAASEDVRQKIGAKVAYESRLVGNVLQLKRKGNI